jgi:hypothetical protein
MTAPRAEVAFDVGAELGEDHALGLLRPDETAPRHNASSPEDTQDVDLAHARFPASRPTRYRDGLLPGG